MDLRVHDRFDSEPVDFVKGPEDRSELVHYDQFSSELVRYDHSAVSGPIDYTLGPPESSKLDQNGNLGNYEQTEHVQSFSGQCLPINFSQRALDSSELVLYDQNKNKRNSEGIECVEKSSIVVQNDQMEESDSWQASFLKLQQFRALLDSRLWLSAVMNPPTDILVKISRN